jgi:putative permease
MRDNNVSKFHNRGKYIFTFGVLLATSFLAINFTRLSIPLVVSYVIYLIVQPLVPRLVKFGINKVLAIVIILLGLGFLLVFPIVKFVPDIQEEVQNLQYYLPKIERYFSENYVQIRSAFKEKLGFELRENLLDDGVIYAKAASRTVFLEIPKIIAVVVEWVFIVPLFLFFLLKDSRSMKRLILQLIPNSMFERAYYLSHQFNKQLGGYIFAKFIEASIVTTIITTGLFILDVRFYFILGLVAGITNIIPYLGPLLGMIPALILGLAEYGGVGPSFWAILILYSVANAIDIAIVFPLLVSKIVDLHPIVVVASVMLGSQYMGVVGMIISIPLATAIKLIFVEIYSEVYSEHSR